MNRWGVCVMVAAVLSAMPGGAAPKKKEAPAEKPAEGAEGQPSAADFLGGLGDAVQGNNSGDLKDAASGMHKRRKREQLAPRAQIRTERDNTVQLKGVWLAQKIMMTSQGCVTPSKHQQVRSLNAPDLPFIVEPFSVCARLESGRGRAVEVTFRIVTAKGRLVGSAQQRVDFGGRRVVDVVVDYPELPFPVAGVYKYRLEVEGAMAGQMDLLELKLTPRAPRPSFE